MKDDEMTMQILSSNFVIHHIMFGNISLLQTIPMLRKAGPRMLNWSAHWHIHTKICNRLDPATTEKLVYVYSNSKMVAGTLDTGELKMFAWDNKRWH